MENNSLLTAFNVDDEDTDEMNVIRYSPCYSLEDFIEHINTLDMGFTKFINAKFDNLTIFLNTINSQNTKIDAICIQEEWLNEYEDMCCFQMPNYDCISQSKQCSSHTGLIIYLHKKYQFKVMNISQRSDISEALFVDISSTNFYKHIIIGNIYKPPKDNNNNTNIQVFTSELIQIIQSLDKNKTVILCSDFNINLLQINSRPAFSDYLDLLQTHNFIPTITFPTRFTDISCTLIDNIFFKGNNQNNLSSGKIFTDISDHLPCFTTLNLTLNNNYSQKYLYKRFFSDTNISDELALQNIYSLLHPSSHGDPDLNYQSFESCITATMD